MFNFDCIEIWNENLDHPYRILIARDFRSGKINALLNLINHEAYIDIIYLYVKDPHEVKYRGESNSLKSWNISKNFIKYSNDVEKNIEEYNPNKKQKKYWLYLMIWLLICLKIKNVIQ